TKGHHHAVTEANPEWVYPEIYEVWQGTVLYIQQGINAEGKMEFIATIARPGDKMVMLPGYSHRTVNIGSEPVVMFDWMSVNVGGYKVKGADATTETGEKLQKTSSVFDEINKRNGYAFFVMRAENGDVRFEFNPAYGEYKDNIDAWLAEPLEHITLADGLELHKGTPLYNVVKTSAAQLAEFMKSGTPTFSQVLVTTEPISDMLTRNLADEKYQNVLQQAKKLFNEERFAEMRALADEIKQEYPDLAAVLKSRADYEQGDSSQKDGGLTLGQQKLQEKLLVSRYGRYLKINMVEQGEGKRPAYSMQYKIEEIIQTLQDLERLYVISNRDVIADLKELVLKGPALIESTGDAKYAKVALLAARVLVKQSGKDAEFSDEMKESLVTLLDAPGELNRTPVSMLVAQLMIRTIDPEGEFLIKRVDGLNKNQQEALRKELEAKAVAKRDGGMTDGLQSLLQAVRQRLSQLLEQMPASKKGGIDFRALPVSVPQAVPQMPLVSKNVSAQELSKRWTGIQAKVQSGPMPYQEIKEYVSLCSANQEAKAQLQEVHAYIANILKLEEERAVATAPELKEVLCCLG
ncbi:MAG: glucose-6-phosphate isomerase family protein, partial [Candidatus Omnitrophica bacterium]|nr:glucose-6-phosphate isomerase family protein [Candidatus Omnitrophota bacterium]